MDQFNPAIRRSGPRCELVLKVEYESLGKLRSDYLSSLGAGGLFLRTELPLTVGQVLTMAISFPGALEPLQLVGEVKWVANSKAQPGGAGVEFRNLTPDLKNKLSGLVAQANQTVTAPQTVSSRQVSAVLMESNPILRDIFRFNMTRFARSGGNSRPIWDLSLETVTTPEELFNALQTKKWHVAILDFESQSVDPAEMLNQIRLNPSWVRLPVIILGEGATDTCAMCVKKPVSMKPLFTTLSLFLEG